MKKLQRINIVLSTKYSNPIGIGPNTIAKNWAGFIKLHLNTHTMTVWYS